LLKDAKYYMLSQKENEFNNIQSNLYCDVTIGTKKTGPYKTGDLLKG